MKKVNKYENQKVLVLGLARSGMSAASLLHDLGALVTVNDGKSFDDNPEAQELLAKGIRVIAGSHPVELLDEDFTLVVKNPGIPYSNPILEKAIEKDIPIITEVELAYQISEAKIVGITGTNGKTTTTTMIGEILNAGLPKGEARLAGNIGMPASGVAQEVNADDVMVTELSSFQLMGIQEFKPAIGIIVNLYEAHLDYHGSREGYVKAKWELQKNMTASDVLILNGNQEELVKLSQETNAKVMFFSTEKELDEGAYCLDGRMYYKGEYIMDSSEIGVPGGHNIENALASICVAKLLDVENKAIKEAISAFGGVEHRTEYVGEIEGRKYYNDSKATNMLATEKALSGFDNSKVILLAGGLDRGNSFDEFIPTITGLKGIVLFGESKNKIEKAAVEAGINAIKVVDTLEEAVCEAEKMSSQGDSVLLSPACASWDQYKNFEIRGTVFKDEVKKIQDRSER